MKKAYGYIRVSTETQAEKGYGLVTQESAMKDYCNSNGIELVECFYDRGVSGTTADRDGLTDLMAALTEGETKEVVVMNTSRLWRSDSVKVIVKRELEKINAEVISIEQPSYSIYIKDPNDFLINGVMELLDQYDRMSINLKLARGRKSKAKGGTKGGGLAPIGYKWKHDGVSQPIIIMDEEYGPLIKHIFKLYMEHKSLGKVKKKLDEMGCVTRNGKEFSRQALQVILKNPFYKGEVNHADIKVKGNHEPLVSSVQFGKVQALLKRNQKSKS